MTDTIALDIHTHMIPVDDAALAGFDGVSFDGTMTIDGHRIGMASLFSPEALLAWMDRHAIAAAWVSAPPPTYRQHLRGADTRAWVGYLNAGLDAIAARYPDRLSALPHLPPEEPEIALEIARAGLATGHRRFAMPTGTGDGRVLSDDVYDPLWRMLDDAAALVLFHPGEAPDPRLERYYLGNLLGNPYETALAIAHLVFAGVPERFPRLTLCFAHAGGATPAIAGRLQRGFDTNRPGLDTRLAPPAEQLARLVVDCISHGTVETTLAETVFGERHVVFGSDWPFPMGITDPGAQLAGLDAATRDRILTLNPERLLRT